MAGHHTRTRWASKKQCCAIFHAFRRFSPLIIRMYVVCALTRCSGETERNTIMQACVRILRYRCRRLEQTKYPLCKKLFLPILPISRLLLALPLSHGVPPPNVPTTRARTLCIAKHALASYLLRFNVRFNHRHHYAIIDDDAKKPSRRVRLLIRAQGCCSLLVLDGWARCRSTPQRSILPHSWCRPCPSKHLRRGAPWYRGPRRAPRKSRSVPVVGSRNENLEAKK